MAHRSAIKRIQEQDSPPSLPMVLCVSAIVSSPGKGNADNISQDQKSLELTDGWYVIRANVDGPISRAVHSGKIAVGFKIAVSGAKVCRSADHSLSTLLLRHESFRTAGCRPRGDPRSGSRQQIEPSNHRKLNLPYALGFSPRVHTQAIHFSSAKSLPRWRQYSPA